MRTKGLDFMGALKLVANSVGIAVPEPRLYQPATLRTKTLPAKQPFGGDKFRPLMPDSKVFVYLTDKRRLDPKKLIEYSVGETVDGQAYSFAYKWWPPGMPRKEGTRPRFEFYKVVKVDRFNGAKEEWREPKGGKNILFGIPAVPENATELVITEGELDAITFAQYGFPAVSVPCGAGYAGWIDTCWEWLGQFKKIHVSFDEDRAGRAKVVEVVNRLGIARTDIVRLPERAANEV
jgi:twinkle protein